jgi:para-nitrobenzyl esterase
MQNGNYPAVDGGVLPLPPLESMRTGAANQVPMIVGFNHDEVKVAGLVPDFWRIRQQSFAEFYAENATIFTSAELATLRAMYPSSDYANPLDLGVDMIDDIAFACQAQEAAMAMSSHNNSVYAYEFGLGNNAFSLEPYVGTFHGIEIPFVFGTYDIIGLFYGESSGVQDMLELSQRMQRYWTRFAKTHDPNGAGDAVWPMFAPQDTVMLLTPTPGPVNAYRTERCEFWRSRAPEGFGERLDYISRIATQGRGGLPGFE